MGHLSSPVACSKLVDKESQNIAASQGLHHDKSGSRPEATWMGWRSSQSPLEELPSLYICLEPGSAGGSLSIRRRKRLLHDLAAPHFVPGQEHLDMGKTTSG